MIKVHRRIIKGDVCVFTDANQADITGPRAISWDKQGMQSVLSVTQCTAFSGNLPQSVPADSVGSWPCV